MATKKSKDIAPRRAGGLSTNVKWKQQLAAMAAEDTAREPVSSGNTISTRGNKFTLGGSVIPNPMRVIVLDYAFVNAYYGGVAYDKDNPSSPVCFATAKTEDSLTPDEQKVPEPVNETCKGCQYNEFGSAENGGNGKECKNTRKLAVISADVKELTPEYIAGTTIAFINVSPTGIKHWSGYVKKLKNALDMPVCGVVTELDFDPDSDQPVVVPQYLEEIDDEDVMGAILKRRLECQEDLLAGFQQVVETRGKKLKKKEKPVKGKKPDQKKKGRF